MTVIVVIAIAAIAALFYAFIWPGIQKSLVNNTCKTYGEDYAATPVKENISGTKATKWKCCDGNGKGSNCVDVEDDTTSTP